MSLKVRVKVSNPGSEARPKPMGGYQFRPASFFVSVGVHTLAILALGLMPVYEEPTPVRPVLEELVRPQEHKIVYYAFKKSLPDVTATERLGTFPKPRGREYSKDAIIATAPKAKSAQQIIWRPVPKIEIKRDQPAPNLIMRTAAAIPLPAPPPPPEPKKEDKPNIEAPKAEQANLTPPEPKGDPNKAKEDTAKPVEIPKPRKAFVPPTPSKREPRLPVEVQVADVPVPDASITGASSARMALPDGIGTAAFSKGVPPPPNAPPGPENTAGNAKTDVAVASLHPGNGPVPDGARSGAFSRAPIVGEPASGELGGNGIKVPNLTIREDRTKIAEPPKVNPNRKVVLYAEKMRSIPVTTLSVPLRPASRAIPRAIDGRFQGRNVYTMVVPIEKFEPYSGDWILWFAEKQPKSGDTPFVRAPVPLRKYESVEPVMPGAHTELRVQVTGKILADGKLEGLAMLRSMGPGIDHAVLQDLSAWEFKPATRDNVPVEVDVIMEIPYSLPPQIAKSTP